MHYINTAAEIVATHAGIGPDATPEEIGSVYIPFVHRAYQEGKAGMPGYPKDPAAEIAKYEAKRGLLFNTATRLPATAGKHCLAALTLLPACIII